MLWSDCETSAVTRSRVFNDSGGLLKRCTLCADFYFEDENDDQSCRWLPHTDVIIHTDFLTFKMFWIRFSFFGCPAAVPAYSCEALVFTFPVDCSLILAKIDQTTSISRSWWSLVSSDKTQISRRYFRRVGKKMYACSFREIYASGGRLHALFLGHWCHESCRYHPGIWTPQRRVRVPDRSTMPRYLLFVPWFRHIEAIWSWHEWCTDLKRWTEQR